VPLCLFGTGTWQVLNTLSSMWCNEVATKVIYGDKSVHFPNFSALLRFVGVHLHLASFINYEWCL